MQRLDGLEAKTVLPLTKVRVTCRVYTQGNRQITEYCEDGYTCGESNKCLPGPEIRRELEAERARRLAAFEQAQKEMERKSKELEAQAQEFNKMARRADTAAAAPRSATGGNVFQVRQQQQTSGCGSDITGLGGGTPRSGNCNTSGSSTRGPRPVQNPSVPAQQLSLRQQLTASLQIANLLNLRDSFQRGSDDWNNVDDALRDMDKKLLDQGIDLKSKFDDVYNPLPKETGSEVAAAPPPNPVNPKANEPLPRGLGQYCVAEPPPHPDDAHPNNKICWQKASNGLCKKWRFSEDGHMLPSDYDPHDTSFSDATFNPYYTLECPPGADQAYTDATKPAATPPAPPAAKEHPMFGDSQDECGDKIEDYFRGDISSIDDIPDRCRPRLRKALEQDQAAGLDEIAKTKQSFEQGIVPPMPTDDASHQ